MTSDPMVQLLPAARSTTRTSCSSILLGLQRIAQRKPASGVRPRSSSPSGQARPEASQRPTLSSAAPADLQVAQRDAAVEQADLDAAHLGHAVALDLGLDPIRRIGLARSAPPPRPRRRAR